MILAFEDAIIRLHFRNVAAALRRRPDPKLGPATRLRRLRMIEELDRYRRTRPLPRNTYKPGRTPIFVDERGARCAVAHLIEASGRPDLVRRTRLLSNLARIHQMEDPDLASWATEHGLTTDELARIQPAYSLGPKPGSVETLLAMTSVGIVAVVLSAVAMTRRWIRTGVAAFVVALGLAVTVAVVARENPSCEGMCRGYTRPEFLDPILYGFWLLTLIVGMRWLYRRRLERTGPSSAPSRPARRPVGRGIVHTSRPGDDASSIARAAGRPNARRKARAR